MTHALARGVARTAPQHGRHSALVAALLTMLLGLHAAPGSAQALSAADETPRDDTPLFLSPLSTILVEGIVEDAPDSEISDDEIAVFGDGNLDDALRSTPGTFTRDSPQNPGIAVNIRGMEGSGRVTMRIDGIRQNFRFTGHEAQGLVYVDPALLAGIDIERGAVSGPGGGGALAGSANFRTLEADDVLRRGDDAGGFVSAGYGDNGSGLTAAGAAAFRSDAWSIATALSRRSPDDYDNGDGQTVAYTGQSVLSGLVKLDYSPNATHNAGAGIVVYDNDFTANSYTQTIDSRQFSGRYAYTPASDAIDLRAHLYRSDVTMTYEDSPVFTGGGSASGRVIEDIGTGFDLYNTTRIGRWLTTTYGVEYFHDDVEAVNSAAVPDRGVNPSGTSSIGGLFADTRLHWGPAELTVGLRLDRYTIRGHGSVRANNPIGLPEGPYTVDRDDTEFSPTLTLAVDATRWLRPYLTWSRSFRAPTINETLTGGNHPAGPDAPTQPFFPNPFLEPEVSTGWELGVDLHRDSLLTDDDRLRARVDYFRHRVDDYITAAFVGADTGLPGTHFANADGRSTVEGYELDVRYDAGIAFASMAYTDTDSDLPSQVNGFGAQSYLPDRVLSATLGARFFDRRLTFGARYNKVSESYIGDINTPPGVSPYEPGYGLLDLFSAWFFDNGNEIRLNVTNALDRAYTPALSTPAGGTDIDTGRGQTIVLTTRLRF